METSKGYTKKRMSYDIPGQAHELTFSCYQNRQFLKSETICGFFIESLKRAKEKHNFDIWAYVIMPEHIHLLIFPQEQKYFIAKILQSIKQSSSKKAISYFKHSVPEMLERLTIDQKDRKYRFWQDGGGYDRNVYSNALKEMVTYIHNNPIRRGLVDNPEDWKWSSAGEWTNPGTGPIAIDRASFPVLDS
jgi:putative transposase